jgi:hypothetical protein
MKILCSRQLIVPGIVRTRSLYLSGMCALLLVAIPVAVRGAPGTDQVWHRIEARASVAENTESYVAHSPSRTVIRLVPAALGSVLACAPMEFSREAAEGPIELSLPMPDGTFVRFAVVESPILSPALAVQFPTIRTYSGKGIDDLEMTMRLAWTPDGLYALVLGKQGSVMVARSRSAAANLYESSFATASSMGSAPEVGTLLSGTEWALAPLSSSATRFVSSVGSSLRTIRLAIAVTGEYTQQFAQAGDDDATKKLRAYSKIVEMVSAVNAVYEPEMAVRLQLVSGTELVFTDPACDPFDTDPDGNPSTSLDIGVLQQNNQDLLDCSATAFNPCALTYPCLGSANYDLGQVFAVTGHGGNGAGQACTSGDKAKGAMGDGDPGLPLDVNVVLHETGHQFSAGHTFNIADPQRDPTSSYEPGSGSTIMSYAGIAICSNGGGCTTDAECNFGTCNSGSCTGKPTLACGTDAGCVGVCFTPYSIQPLVDPYFHARSFQQIQNHLSSCGSLTTTGNAEPAVDAGPSHTIPSRTPFALTAVGSDPDGDPLTYCWEEFDLGPSSPPETDADGQPRPLFRSYPPTAEGRVRLFPSLTYILNNANNPPANDPVTGNFIAEALPTITRTMTFRATVRDNRAGGGGVASGDTQVNVDGGSGPFIVTAPNSPVAWTTGSTLMVTWDVAGTTAPPVNCASVTIALSTDGGSTFPIVLASSTPNDGSEPVVVPEISSTSARVRVESFGNIFFDISDTDFVLNMPPRLDCHDATVSADPGQCSAVVHYDVSVSDDQAGVQVVCTPADGSALPDGVNMVQCVATDVHGATDQCSFSVTVEDREGPVISSEAANPPQLWAPNHELVDVTISYQAIDNCGTATCQLSAVSDEDDGGAEPDIAVVDEHHVLLRAERLGKGDGRTYTVSITCTDADGNSSQKSLEIPVPHDFKTPK